MGSNIEAFYPAITVDKEEKELRNRDYVSKVDFVPFSMVVNTNEKDVDNEEKAEPVQPIVVYLVEAVVADADEDIDVHKISVEDVENGDLKVVVEDDIHLEVNVDCFYDDYYNIEDIEIVVDILKSDTEAENGRAKEHLVAYVKVKEDKDTDISEGIVPNENVNTEVA